MLVPSLPPRGPGGRGAGRGIIDRVGTHPGHRVFAAVLTVLFAYVLFRAVTAPDPSTVSIVIRATGLAVCSWSLGASLLTGRERRRRDAARRDAADG